MRKMYKNGESCNVEEFQVELMKEGGWSLTPEKAKAVEPEELFDDATAPEDDEAGDADGSDESAESEIGAAKKVIRKKVIKK